MFKHRRPKAFRPTRLLGELATEPTRAACECDEPDLLAVPCPFHTPGAYVMAGAKHYGSPVPA